jgi:hypothetical protein
MRVLARRAGRPLLGLLPLGLCLLLAASSSARGDDAAPTGTTPSWTVDVHVVRVDLADPGAAEVAPATDADGTTARSFADCLAELKQRGSTTLLLDQRGTTATGFPLTLRQQQREWIEQFVTRSAGNEQWNGSSLDEGASVLLTCGSLASYQVEVSWCLAQPKSRTRQPAQLSSTWNGTFKPQGGRMLVLRQAKQIVPQGGDRAGVEIYVFLTLIQGS